VRPSAPGDLCRPAAPRDGVTQLST
jgi:hypothetical protein